MNQKLKKILEEVAVIMGATGFVPLILSPFNISTFIISVISVFLFLFILAIYHWSFLNKKIQSSMLIVISLFIATITLILIHEYYIISPFKKKYEISNSFLSHEIGEKIKSSKNEIWFFGQNFHISAGDRREELLNRLENGVNVKYLIVDPRDKNLVDLIGKDYDFKSVLNELKSSFSHLVNLQKKVNESSNLQKGNLEIRLMNSQPFYRGYFFDPKQNKNSAYIVPYMNTYYSSEIPGYLFEKFDENSIPHKYFSSVLKMWNMSKQIGQEDIEEISNL